MVLQLRHYSSCCLSTGGLVEKALVPHDGFVMGRGSLWWITASDPNRRKYPFTNRLATGRSCNQRLKDHLNNRSGLLSAEGCAPPPFHFLATTRNCLPKSGQANFNFKYRRNIQTGGCPPRDIV